MSAGCLLYFGSLNITFFICYLNLVLKKKDGRRAHRLNVEIRLKRKNDKKFPGEQQFICAGRKDRNLQQRKIL